jgi:hypothetical protein
VANNKLRIVSNNDTLPLRPEIGNLAQSGCTAGLAVNPQADEGLRLLRAFSRIGDQGLRAWLIEQAERAAGV